MGITVMSWNVRDFDGPGQRWDERDSHLKAIAAVIKDVDPDIVCIQEIRGSAPDRSLARLGEAAGLDWCATPGWVDDEDAEAPTAAVGIGDADFHVGLLWRLGISPVPGSFRQIGRAQGGLWHAAASIDLQVGGPVPLTVVCCHLDPFRAEMRFSEAGRIASLAIGKTAVVAGDFNGPSADRRADGSYYDPDSIEQRGWYAEATYQVEWGDDPDAAPRVDRRAAERLRRAGIVDAAAVLDTPWQPSCGHWPGDPHGERRPDRILATDTAAPALLGCRVIGSDNTRDLSSEEGRSELGIDPKTISDHLPVVVELDESLLLAP